MRYKQVKISSGTSILNVYQAESRGKPTMLCLPGGPGIDVRYLMAGMAGLEDQFDLVFLDFRGCGASEEPKDNNYTLESYLEDVATVVDQLSFTKDTVLFGHSFGACIAIKALAKMPNSFSYGILANGLKDTKWLALLEETVKELKNPTAKEIEHRFKKSSKTDADFKEYTLSYAPLYCPELPLEKSQELLRSYAYRAKPYLKAAESIFPNMNLSQDCQKIQCPCLVIGGELDKVVAPSIQKDMAELIAKATFKVVPATGHFPFATRSADFSEIIRKWWKEA